MSEQGGRRAQPKRVHLSQDPYKALAAKAPWVPEPPSPEQIGAIKAISRGTADSNQQQIAFQFVVDFSHNGGAHYFPGEDGRRDTDFALGRALLGKMFVTISKMILRPGGEQA